MGFFVEIVSTKKPEEVINRFGPFQEARACLVMMYEGRKIDDKRQRVRIVQSDKKEGY